MKKLCHRYAVPVLALVLSVAAASCSNLLGYGVLQWSIPEKQLYAGDMVPVYIRSNISQVYVIGMNGTDEKLEVPLWQIRLFSSKREAAQFSESMAEFFHTYARVALDGLPVRFDPDNTSRQIYRLRENEVIKVLGKGKGSPVMMGNAPVEGDWLNVLTSDGTRGWCFSYNLRLYNELETDVEDTSAEYETDELLESVLVKTWYPESYKTMIDSQQIDPASINPAWGFNPGQDTGIVQVLSSGMEYSSSYSGIKKTASRQYAFEGSTLTMQIRRSDYLVLQYADSRGMPKTGNFVALSISPTKLVEDELERRRLVYEQLRTLGPVFSSTSYGQLRLLEDGRFLWSGYGRLSPSVIPAAADGKGRAEIRFFIDKSLASEYDGVISFLFDNTSRYVNFLYRLDGNGFRMEEVPDSSIRNDLVVTRRSATPLILYFAAQNDASSANRAAGGTFSGGTASYGGL
ncbi:MAG: SH3 domain-containing protein [Spirochaetaceae bacterium]|jgi:catechol 2,3-dioxygenase-like lactoylglutathione lyase family enzyme|nr:SH3 domain-containing protein [Spirochaetaceae bacterium]